MSNKEKYQFITKKGYDFFEVSSALQKAIRRCLEEEALYWATEMWNSDYQDYVWRRLAIVVSEDIGFAEPMGAMLFAALRQNYLLATKGGKLKDNGIQIYYHAVLFCVRAKKSRLVDWVKNVQLSLHNSRLYEIPDYALDIHTKRGKKRGATIEDFFTEGSKLGNHVPQEGEEEAMRLNYNFATLPKVSQEAINDKKYIPGYDGRYDKDKKSVKPKQPDNDLFSQ
jgi:replication-associated recombination protein RarA